MTTMKLQKLAFYSQAESLARRGHPLFDEDFQAWRGGPVCRELYAQHRGKFLIREGELPVNDCEKTLSEEEKEQVFRRAKAEGVTLSMYLRKSVLGERITSKADIQTVFELKKIGTNLNQLAKHVNSLPVDENIRISLESIEMYIKELKQITDKLI